MGEDQPAVRLAGRGDAERVRLLRREWCREVDGDPADSGSFDQDFTEWFAAEADRRVFFLAEAAGRSIGMLNLTIFDRMPRPARPASRWCYLGNAYVLPDHRNMGVGTALLRAATTWADDHGAARIVLAPSELSVPLYERAGFAVAVAGELLVRPGGRPTDGGTGRAGSSGRTSRP